MTATSETTATPEQTVIYEKITIIGVGLIGASTALAARRGKLAGHITACDADPDAVETSRKLGFADEVVADPQQAVIDADLVIMAVPVGAMGALAASIVPAMKPGAVLTDSGSTKRSVLRDVDPVISDDIHWLPSHPLAGTEHSGPAAGHAHLFDGRYWILVPRDVPDDVVVRFESFLAGLGSVTERMDADYHDKVLALTSHLPHLIAYTIVSTAVDLETQLKNDVIRFSASGFRDFTRIAASDPVMWRDVFVNNDEAVLEMLQRFSEDLSYLQRAIRWGEKDKLETLFTRTREIRRSIIDAGQD
ncbi:MAG: prephenate/arogenate dehydrogenase family protein [Alphaproteobacteria bacterium]|jgi:cyclohexadieny/prephenate dehydrogenase|nr:prephenate/arogenate dehydrogenase family protein [Alphaproteobacteria bacterium]